MKFKNLVPALLALAATTLLLANPAQATLLGRDINGHAVDGSHVSAVFLYDTDLNITWLRDANASETAGNTDDPAGSGFGGHMSWYAAINWANTLSVGGFSGWRLPTAPQSDPTCSSRYNGPFSPLGTLYFGLNCTASEMGHLWYQELGNIGGRKMLNVGAFLNFQLTWYWSGSTSPQTLSPLFPDDCLPFAWGLEAYHGSQHSYTKDDTGFHGGLAMAVRPGDVLISAVPEPGTLVLVMAALLGLGAVRRRAIGTSET